VQTIGRNLVKLLDERIAWHREKRGGTAPLLNQSLSRITRAHFQQAVDKNVSLRARARVLAQLDQLEAGGAQLRRCAYGPTSPDGTGSIEVTFWYKSVPVSTAELMMVSRQHPVLGFGDTAITECPAILPEAERAWAESLRVGQSRVNESALPAEIPLDVLGSLEGVYQSTKTSWLTFVATGNDRFRRQAIVGKDQLLRTYGRSCESPPPGNGPDNIYCRLARQLADELQDIPSSPGVPAPAAPGAAPRGDATPSPIADGTVVSVLTVDPINLLDQDESRRYRARLQVPARTHAGTIPAGAEVLLKMVRKAASTPDTVNVALTVVSITIDGTPVPVTSRERVRPAPVPGTRYQGPAVLAAGTPLQFAIGR
jgi:hypothetical protein